MKRDLSTLDRDIGQDWSRIIQEAFAHGMTNDMVFGGLEVGQTALQGLYEASTVKNCRLGTRRITWDGRVFRYAKASNIIVVRHFGLKFYDRLADGIAANLAAESKAGATTITIPAANVAANDYADGYVVIHATAEKMFRRVLSNTATSGGNIILTLDGALTSVAASGTYTEVLKNPYGNVALCAGPSGGHTGDGFSSVAGVPVCLTTVENSYLWIQTWGPTWINPHGDAATGVSQCERKLVFDAEGSVCVADQVSHGGITGTDGDEQVAGFIIERVAGGPPFVMLQISP